MYEPIFATNDCPDEGMYHFVCIQYDRIEQDIMVEGWTALRVLMVGFVLEEIECGHLLGFMRLEICHQCLDVILQKHVWVVEGHHVLKHMKALDVVLVETDSTETIRCTAINAVHRLQSLYCY